MPSLFSWGGVLLCSSVMVYYDAECINIKEVLL